MDGEQTQKEKLLEACGVPDPRLPAKRTSDGEHRKFLETLVDSAENASAWAQQAQDHTDKAYRRLNHYIEKELPAQLVKAYEEVTKNQAAVTMQPLDNSVRNAVAQVDIIVKGLDVLSWEPRVIFTSVLVGIFTVLVGGCLVRCTFLDDKIDEAKRYEVFGRRVEVEIRKFTPKDQAKLYKYIGGKP